MNIQLILAILGLTDTHKQYYSEILKAAKGYHYQDRETQHKTLSKIKHYLYILTGNLSEESIITVSKALVAEDVAKEREEIAQRIALDPTASRTVRQTPVAQISTSTEIKAETPAVKSDSDKLATIENVRKSVGQHKETKKPVISAADQVRARLGNNRSMTEANRAKKAIQLAPEKTEQKETTPVVKATPPKARSKAVSKTTSEVKAPEVSQAATKTPRKTSTRKKTKSTEAAGAGW